MYFLLILFFGSLIGIALMVGRKLVLLQNGQITPKKDSSFGAHQYMEELKLASLKSLKKNGYIILVATIRFYVQSSNLMKAKLEEARTALKNMQKKSATNLEAEKQGVNNFLNMVSEYKKKVREIKHKITKEEENRR